MQKAAALRASVQIRITPKHVRVTDGRLAIECNALRPVHQELALSFPMDCLSVKRGRDTHTSCHEYCRRIASASTRGIVKMCPRRAQQAVVY